MTMKYFPHLKTHYNFAFIPYNGVISPFKFSIPTQKHMAENYNTKPNDVYLMSYPKAGQHLVKKICIELIRHHDKENTHKLYSTGDIGMDSVPLKELLVSHNGLEAVNKRNEDLKDTLNLWWTHNPYSLFTANKDTLHPNTRYIVINRNPKDLLISYWNWQNKMDAEDGGCDPKISLNDFLMRFVSGMLYFGCYYEWTLDWFKAYSNDIFNKNGQMLFIYYEDILNEPFNTIKSIKDFLYSDDDNITEKELQNIVELTRFDEMKQEQISNPQSFLWTDIYFRSGKENDWMNHLNQQQSDLLDDIMWIKWGQHGTGIKYYSELMQKYADYDHGFHSNINNK
eukprot:134409_1